MELTVPEQIVLLALSNETGERKTEMLEYAAAGAALTEFVILGRLVEAAKAKEKHPSKFSIPDWAPTGDAFLDQCAAVIQAQKKPKKAEELVAAIANTRRILTPLIDGLIARGILRQEKKKFLFFKRTVYPEANPNAEQALTASLEGVMFRGETPTTEQSVVIALAHQLSLLKHNFDKAQLKIHKLRIKEIAEGKHLGSEATKAAIEAMHAVLAITAVMPAIMVATG